MVCTKHLLRLAPTTRWRHQRGEQQRLRSLETHLCPPTGRLKAPGSGRRPVPVSTQLGDSPQLVESTSRPQMSSEHGSPINAQDSGTFAPSCSFAVGAARVFGAATRARSPLGPVRRPALPCPSSAISRLGVRSSRCLHADRGACGAPGARAHRRGRAGATGDACFPEGQDSGPPHDRGL